VGTSAYRKGTFGGLEHIDGVGAGDNGTRNPKLALTDDESTVIVCTVHPGRILVHKDGQQVMEWQGQFDRLSSDGLWNLGDSGRIWLAKHTGLHSVTRLRIKPLSAPAEIVPVTALEVLPSVDSTDLDRFRVTLSKRLEGHQHDVFSVAFSGDRKTLAAGGGDMSALWDIGSGQLLKVLDDYKHWGGYAVEFSPDGTKLAACGQGRNERITNVYSAAGKKQKTFDGATRAMSFSSEARLLAMARDRNVHLANIETGGKPLVIKGHRNSVYCVAFAPDDKTLASGSCDRTIKLWDPDTGKQKATLDAHEGEVWGLAYSPDGTTLASAAGDRRIILWDTKTNQPRLTLTGHEGQVNSVAFFPDGKTLVSTGWDRTVRFWDVATGQPLGWFAAHDRHVWCVALSTDGKQMATAGGDRVIKIWDVQMAEPE
jgi:WD40 repeat protein